MKSDRFYPWAFFILLPLQLALYACAPAPALAPAATSTAAPPAATPPPATSLPVLPTALPQEPTATVTAPPAEEGTIVAFVQDGGIHLWHEGTGEQETIFNEGGALSLSLSDDGQRIAFVRTWFDFNLCSQTALWVVDRDGGNARELVSPADLNATLGDADCEYPFVTFAQFEWLPGTHRLLYSVIMDAPHAPPQGLYLADADTLSVTELVSTANSLRFEPSPDGFQIALISATELGFINADGSNWRQDVLTYPQSGIPIPLLPNGVWAQDGRSFLIAAPTESDSAFVLNYDILRVPTDGSSAGTLASITDSHGDSVTFSPDGQHAAFLQEGAPSTRSIIPLAAGAGPLAIPSAVDLGTVANLHWSPAGDAYVVREGALLQLCPEAAQDTEICGDPVNLDSRVIALIQWLDSDSFLFLTRDPYTLFLARLDGTKTPVVTWGPEERSQSFSPVQTARQKQK